MLNKMWITFKKLVFSFLKTKTKLQIKFNFRCLFFGRLFEPQKVILKY
jgi:hypothetical protein